MPCTGNNCSLSHQYVRRCTCTRRRPERFVFASTAGYAAVLAQLLLVINLGPEIAFEMFGLAAEQVGRREAMFVLDVPPADEDAGPPSDPPVPMPLVLINPEIVERRGEQRGQEGCLSFPEIYVDVTRGFEVVARFMDLEGADHTITARGMLARAIQHELDHLNGVLLVDQMSPVQKVAVAGKLKRLKRQNRGA